ncbi:glycosyltransferase [Sphingomonas crocodyli]|uniref:Glycosyltransferase n=1 Tax=Sphingomonas crocodyli TaxID=1979270 RepID=A0A437MBC7_9SPHN|nr:glycosyltransferase [Sphingomonas crocodyli]RVT94938.1 glycosyltransferase [Sphingomonas crocodyli]
MNNSNPLTVSIVIATANRAVSLDRTLHSLRQLRYEWFEVVLVDGSPDDDTKQVADRHKHFVRYYRCPELNISMSRNIGIAHARGDIVAFIDDDAIPEPDWLDRLLTGYEDPSVAQVGGFIRDYRGIDYQCRYVTFDRLGDGTHHEDIEDVVLDDSRFLALTGTNFSARRNRLMEINGFDEEYAYFLDETDVTVRLHDRGWTSAIIPDAEIHHKYEASHMRTATRVPRTMYPQIRSKAYFSWVHGRKNHGLDEILKYLAQLIAKERVWKTDLFHHNHTDMETVARLIDEVERGARDGLRDAFYYAGPRGISGDLIEQAKESVFKKYPLPLNREDRLRICFLSQDYPPVGNGGIGQWTRDMATSLSARGHEVTVICRSETDYPYIDFVDGVWVHRIVQQPYDRATSPIYAPAPHSLLHYSGSVFEEIMRIQEHRQFQVICGPIFDLEPLVALRESGIPTILSLHTTYKLVLPHKPEWISDIAYKAGHVDAAIAAEKALLESAPFIESNTHAVVADLEDAYDVALQSDRVQVIHRGLHDLSKGVEPFPSSPGNVRLLFVGRLELRKGADLLLDALPSLLEQHANLVVDIVGDDSVIVDGRTLREAFEEQAKAKNLDLERVSFHGAVSRENLLRHYASCDIFAAPSRYESFGLIFVEAMIFSKPVVGIAVGGVPEVVTNEVDGLLIPVDDKDLLTSQISRLIDNPELRTKIGMTGRTTFETRFHIERMLDESEAYYKKVSQRGAKSPSEIG